MGDSLCSIDGNNLKKIVRRVCEWAAIPLTFVESQSVCLIYHRGYDTYVAKIWLDSSFKRSVRYQIMDNVPFLDYTLSRIISTV